MAACGSQDFEQTAVSYSPTALIDEAVLTLVSLDVDTSDISWWLDSQLNRREAERSQEVSGAERDF